MSDDFSKQVYDTIKTMEKEREEAHRAPSVILYRDLLGRLECKEKVLKDTLNLLFTQRLIRVGATINDKYITTKIDT